MVKIFWRIIDVVVSSLLLPVIIAWFGAGFIKHGEIWPSKYGNIAIKGTPAVVLGYLCIVIAFITLLVAITMYIQQYPGFMWFIDREKTE